MGIFYCLICSFTGMQFPEDSMIDPGMLSGCFKNTTATYKFYWFLAILKETEQGHERIDKMSLFAHMIAHAWYTVNYSRVSFGALDNLQKAVEVLRELESIPVDANPDYVHNVLITSQNPATQRELWHFDRNVPHKFLSPWLGSGSKSGIYLRSQHGDQ